MVKKTIGMSVDGFWVNVAPCFTDLEVDAIAASPLGGRNSIPNSILLPRFPAEPYRIDMGVEPHPRGSGLSWPVEAMIHTQYGVGRIPLGVLLESIEQGDSVSWQTDEMRRFACSEAFAGAIAQVIGDVESEAHVLLAIPNHWNEVLQQKLIDAFQDANIKVTLLWRPIAAAFDWCEQFAEKLNTYTGDIGESVGKLFSLYIGFDTIEVTELELVQWQAEGRSASVVPARKRPRQEDRLPSFGIRQAIQYLRQQYHNRLSGNVSDSELLAALWNQLWCSHFPHELQVSPVFNEVSSGPANDLLESNIARIEQLHPHQVRSRLQQCRLNLQKHYDGIVVSGALANCKFLSGARIWEWALDGLGVCSENALVEGLHCDDGLLAKGAGIFAHRLEKKLPTYLDTLPRLEMLISDKGEPTWIDLLEPEQKWVEGGRLWQRPEKIRNLSIAAGSIDLKLAVAHEEFRGVRELVADLPEAKSEEKVSLSVQMFPAQGSARIEIHPDRVGYLENQRVFVDWRRMKEITEEDGRPTTKQDYLNGLPRSFPELLPRVMSAARWRKARESMATLLKMFRRNEPLNAINHQLVVTRDLIRAKDPSKFPQDATAFDSDGNCAGDFDLDDFISAAWDYYIRFQPSKFIRAIAYTHVNHKPFHDNIIRNLQGPIIHEDYIVAAGKCLREAEHISSFLEVFFKTRRALQFNRVWWRALSEILRFRGNATQLISSQRCYDLMQLAWKGFKSDRLSNSGTESFRLECLVIVYTLRRRAYDDTFLDPESDLAVGIKNEFRQARADAKAGRLWLMGGSIDLSQQLQLIIDYVDRRGRGQLLIGD